MKINSPNTLISISLTFDVKNMEYLGRIAARLLPRTLFSQIPESRQTHISYKLPYEINLAR